MKISRDGKFPMHGKNRTVPMYVLGDAREGDVVELADEGNIPLCPRAD